MWAGDAEQIGGLLRAEFCVHGRHLHGMPFGHFPEDAVQQGRDACWKVLQPDFPDTSPFQTRQVFAGLLALGFSREMESRSRHGHILVDKRNIRNRLLPYSSVPEGLIELPKGLQQLPPKRLYSHRLPPISRRKMKSRSSSSASFTSPFALVCLARVRSQFSWGFVQDLDASIYVLGV